MPDASPPPEPVPAGRRADRVAAALLDGPLTALILLACGAMLATWLPHYPTWPFWSDYDGFAMMARAWDLGERPYRDIASNQFPGPIHAAWLLGKLFGWGRTAPAFAADAALLLLLLAALLAWSRRLFGRMLPGAIGSAAVLGYYLNLDYTLVLQRDWHAAALVVLGLLAVQAAPGRGGRFVSAAAFALALSIRPQVVLFLPALALALAEAARPPGTPPRAALGPLLRWAATAAGLTALAFAPVLVAGLGDDLVRCLRDASYASRYSTASPKVALVVLALQLLDPRRLLPPLFLAAALALGGPPPRTRRVARAWLVAALAALLYRPLSPVPQHEYLTHPLALVAAVLAALLAELVVEAGDRGLSPAARLVTLAALLALMLPGPPRFCDAAAALRSVPHLLRGEDPPDAPPGYTMRGGLIRPPDYPWRDYRALLLYLRTQAPPGLRVANLLYHPPAVLGCTARLPAFPCDAGVIWLFFIDPAARPDFARRLADAADALVVWIPGEPPPRPEWDLATLRREVPRHYEPEARFGSIEVWRRKAPPR